MQIHSTKLAIGGLTLLAWGALTVTADASSPWTNVPAGEARAPARSSLQRELRLDLETMRSTLALAPKEGTGVAVALPLPEGGYRTYRLLRSEVMPEELAARHPQIGAFRGADPEKPSVSVRAELTSLGFHARIDEGKRVVLVDPDATGGYVSYRREVCDPEICPNARRGAGFSEFGLGRDEDTDVGDKWIPTMASNRVIRIAVATTSAFTDFWGGTQQDGLSGVLQAINRVNDIFERDLAVTLELAPNNIDLIFTTGDPNPDVFPDPQRLDPASCDVRGASALAGNTIFQLFDRVVGAGNWDLGHVLGVDTTNWGMGGGRVVVCQNIGCSFNTDPTGDAFWVDYFAHEIGHQLGAEHTLSSCAALPSLPLPNVAHRVEPGGGTTIMAYGGVCGTDSVQPHQDPYFHARSLRQIQVHLGTRLAGCSQTRPTLNRVPFVDAGPDYVIPAGTPFYLTGSASDPDGDSLTYAWEQNDGCSDAARCGALFRSFPPTENGRRYFPSSLQPGTPWEELPLFGRDMTFRLAVRDNHAGAGAAGWDDATVTVQENPNWESFNVIQPHAGDQFAPGSSITVEWNVADTDQPPVSCANVDIKLSLDGIGIGDTFNHVLAASTPNDGFHTVTLPAGLSSTYEGAHVWVECTTTPFFALSRAFTVQ